MQSEGSIFLHCGRNQAVSLAGDGLDVLRSFWIVAERLAELTDRHIEAIVGIQGYALSPDLLRQVFAADDLPLLLDEHGQRLKGNPLQPEHGTTPAQPGDARFECKVGS